MSKTVSVALKAHMALEATTLATCWKVTRTDGVVMGFTSCDQDLVVSGVTYKASTGYAPTDNQTTSDLNVDNLEVEGILDSTAITDTDLATGVYDFAQVQVFLVNYLDLTMGIMILRTGYLGDVTRKRGQFQAEIRGLTQLLQESVGRSYSTDCDVDLGAARCQVNLASFTVTGTVTAAPSARQFTDSSRAEASAYFQFGRVLWTSGLNNGRKMEIKTFAGGVFTLFQAMPFNIQVGDTYQAYAGCNKKLLLADGTLDPNGCSKFSNVINFQGFHKIPGSDQVLAYPDAK